MALTQKFLLRYSIFNDAFSYVQITLGAKVFMAVTDLGEKEKQRNFRSRWSRTGAWICRRKTDVTSIAQGRCLSVHEAHVMFVV